MVLEKSIEKFKDFLKGPLLNWLQCMSLGREIECPRDSEGRKTFFSSCILWYLFNFVPCECTAFKIFLNTN